MVFPMESVFGCHLVKGRVERPFEFSCQLYVGDLTALLADEVMMVIAGDLFGQFIARVIVGGHDAMDHPHFFEHYQIAVRRALGKLAVDGQHLSDGGWPRQAQKSLNNGPAVERVTMRFCRQFCSCQLMNFSHGNHRSGYEINWELAGTMRLAVAGLRRKPPGSTKETTMAYPQPTTTPVIHADEDTRAQFLVKVYQHVVLGVVAFMAIEAFLFASGLAEVIADFVFGAGGIGWLAILGGFMVVSTIAGRSAQKIGNTSAQYGALFMMAGAQALLFTPFLYIVFSQDQAGSVVSAAVVTIVGFAALTAVAMTTRRDLSRLRPFIMWGSIVALGLIVVSTFIGSFQLGLVFSVAMVGLAGASILYETQNVVRRYPEWAYVAAAVSLFSSLMLMFWYVLRIFAGRD